MPHEYRDHWTPGTADFPGEGDTVCERCGHVFTDSDADDVPCLSDAQISALESQPAEPLSLPVYQP